MQTILRTLLASAVLAALIPPVTGTITSKESDPKQEVSAKETVIDGLVIDAEKKPIVDAGISIRSYGGDKVNAIEPIYLRSDSEGRFRASVPSKRFCIHVGSPSEAYDDFSSIGVLDGRPLAGWPEIENRSTDDVLKPVVTLQRAYALEFDLIDATTGKPIPDAAILDKDDEAFWYGDGESDYDRSARWHAYRVLRDGRTLFRKKTAEKMRASHILVLATGYEPARLKLDETLRRGETLVKRIEMRPLPSLELTIVAPDGKPAAGATFTTLEPKEFRRAFDYACDRGPLLNIEETSDAQGIVRVAYPAFGDWAAYRILHPAGYADLRIKDLPEAVENETTVRVPIELTPYVTIRGQYVPEVAENEFLEIYRLKSNRLSVDGPAVLVELDGRRCFQLGPRLAGWHTFVHRIRYTDDAGRECTSAVGVRGPFWITAGQTVDLTLGSEGRAVTGRLVLPDDADPKKRLFKVSVESGRSPGYPRAPSGITDEEALKAWWDGYWQSDEGRRYRQYKNQHGTTVTDAAGRFRIPSLSPGKFTLRLVHRPQDSPRLTLSPTEFDVPPGYGSEPLDLGDLKLSAEK